MLESIEVQAVIVGVVLASVFAVIGFLHRQNLADHAALAKAIDDVKLKIAAGQQQIEDREKHTDERFESIERKLDRGAQRMDGISEKVGVVAESVARIEGKMAP